MAHPLTPNGAIYDDFRAVAPGTNLLGRVSTSGHTWVSPSGGGDQSVWSIVDDSANGSLDGNVALFGGLDYGRLGIEFGAADVDVEVTFGYDGGGISLRNTTFTGYAVQCGGSSADIIKVSNYGSGAASYLASWTGIAGIADGGVLRVVAAGSLMSVYVNGTLIGSASDSSYAGTNHGVYARFGNAGQTAYAFNMHPAADGWVVGLPVG